MNLYLPVYKRLEDEVISLTKNIFFDDHQLSTYSLSTADIIIRCSIEIEAIAKELYIQLGGDLEPKKDDGNKRDLYFDTDCMALLVERWKINEKKIQIIHPNMYFSQDKSVLMPLHKSHKRGTSGSKWKQAYQNIKHNRAKKIKWASVENMLSAIGALYILNLYYADESFWSETFIQGRKEFNPESQIFMPFIADVANVKMQTDMSDEENLRITDPFFSECIYVKKLTEEAFREIHNKICHIAISFSKRALAEGSYNDIKSMSMTQRAQTLDQITKQIGFADVDTMKREFAVGGIHRLFQKKEIVLNKHGSVYPSLKYVDYLQSEEGRKEIEA